MDKIQKELAKLTPKEREHLKEILRRIQAGDLKGLDIKKLKAREDIFRVRKGSMRVIYRVVSKEIFVLAVERRSEKTYR